jgi:hypothetical protein
LQGAEADVLVHRHAVVVFLAGEDQLAVEEDLEGVLAAGPDLYGLPARRAHRRKRVRRRAHVFADTLV